MDEDFASSKVEFDLCILVDIDTFGRGGRGGGEGKEEEEEDAATATVL
jgi:hypothetical protein